MTRYASGPDFRRKVTMRRGGHSRLLTFLLLAAGVAANLWSCRNFALDDAPTDSAGSNAGSDEVGDRGGAPIGGGNGGFSGKAAAGTSGGSRKDASASAWMTGGGGGEAAAGMGGGGDPAGYGGTLPVETVNAASAGTSGVAHGAVSPGALSGLSLWLESSTGSIEETNSRVSKWQDSSGNRNDASEADPARRPSLGAEGLNGWSTVKFDGEPSNLNVSDATSLQFGTEPFTVAFVGEFHNSAAPQFTLVGDLASFTYAGYGVILEKTNAYDPYDGLAISANYPVASNRSAAQRRLGAQLRFGAAVLVSESLNINDGKFRLFVVQRSAPGMLENRINGTHQGRLEISAEIDVSAPGRSLRLGGLDSTIAFRGSIAELVMVRGALSESNLLGLEHYLMEKFGL
jgi:hypothetical protein